jgi:hypothetical protein
MVYNPAMMPPPPQSQSIYQQSHAEAPQTAASRYIRAETAVAQSPTRHNFPATLPMVGPSASPITSTTFPGPPSHRTRITEGMSTSPAVPAVSMKTSPLSLASITSPYHPDQPQIQGRSKNYRAQTLRLGERLRPGREEPMISTDRTQQVVLVQLVAQPRRISLVKDPRCPPRPYQCLPTPCRQESMPPRIGLAIQLVAHRVYRARKEKVINGDQVQFRVDVIDHDHLFPCLSTIVRRKSRR